MTKGTGGWRGGIPRGRMILCLWAEREAADGGAGEYVGKFAVDDVEHVVEPGLLRRDVTGDDDGICDFGCGFD